MAVFTNQAQLSYNNTITNSNIAVGEILEVLSGSKTALINDYVRGGDVTYIVSIVNSGATAYSGLTVSDDLGAYAFGEAARYPLTYVADSLRYYVNGVLQPTPTVSAAQTLVVTGITIPANGNAMLIYEVEVNQFAPLDTTGTIENTATVTGASLGTPLVLTETISPDTVPILSITKSIDPVPVAENGTLTYTFTIQNTGNTPATVTDNVIITDNFDPILSNLSVTFNGTPWTLNTNYTYNAATGVFATVGGQVTVPAATYTQDPVTGAYIVTPGVSTLVVSGTL